MTGALAALSLHAACAAEESEEVVHALPLPLWRINATPKSTGKVSGKSRWMDKPRCEREMIRSIWLLGNDIDFAMEQKVQ